MVYENKLSERSINQEYMNTKDAPIVVVVGVQHLSGNNQTTFSIGGEIMGYQGVQEGDAILPTTNSFIVPVGATYILKDAAGSNVVQTWNEAKMPLAVGGDSTRVAELEARLDALEKRVK